MLPIDITLHTGEETKGSCSIPFAKLREKQEYQVSNVRVKSKIVTFAGQHN